MNQLAIVIPAYKSQYFEETLESIAKQTDKRFTLYIGDDSSPYDLKGIVDKFTDKIDIRYHRFPNNMGGKNLVGQWERCIDLTEGEPWIWLFSDDDRMSDNAVESVLKTIMVVSENDLLHLNLNVTDQDGKILRKIVYPPHVTNDEFYKGSLTGKLKSFVVEFIFSRKNFNQNGRFQKFDLAWGSDGITWLKLSKMNGITTVPEARIYWRYSGENITSKQDREILWRKYKASVNNYIFYLRFSKGRNLPLLLRSFLGMTYGDIRAVIRSKSYKLTQNTR